MFRPQAQAETHSRPGGAPRTSSPTQAETHSRAPGPPRTSSPKSCCNFTTLIFFYLCVDYKHKHAQDPAACHVLHVKIYFFYL